MPDPLPALAIQFLTEDPEAAFPWEARLGALGRRLLREYLGATLTYAEKVYGEKM